MSNKKLSRAKIKAAIPNSGGLVAIIARRAQYSWGAVRDFIRNDPELAAMMKDEEESIDDMAESTMINLIKDGDKSSAMWWLSRRRRARYGDNIAVTNTEPLRIIVEYRDDAGTESTDT